MPKKIFEYLEEVLIEYSCIGCSSVEFVNCIQASDVANGGNVLD